jgi:predicted MFS family arabinose efflux permease
MTGVYHLAFAAGQIPVGVSLDRYGIKSVFMVLIATVFTGALLTSFAQNPSTFLLGQAVLGLGCSGMLLCPLTYAAKFLSSANFALWSALVLAVGNSGMLLSASPMAYLVEMAGWQPAFLVSSALALSLAILAWLALPSDRGTPSVNRNVGSEFRHVVRIGLSPALRGVICLAFVSFAVVIGIRGMWAGPWLMEVKDINRVAAGNVMLVLTLMLITMPMVIGLVDRRLQRKGALLIGGHLMAGAALVALRLGTDLPVGYDIVLLVIFGIAVSVQPLLFALGRQAVDGADAGKALAAVNLAFFAGAAVIQALSAPVEWFAGVGGVIAFLGALSVLGALVFWWAGGRHAR